MLSATQVVAFALLALPATLAAAAGTCAAGGATNCSAERGDALLQVSHQRVRSKGQSEGEQQRSAKLVLAARAGTTAARSSLWSQLAKAGENSTDNESASFKASVFKLIKKDFGDVHLEGNPCPVQHYLHGIVRDNDTQEVFWNCFGCANSCYNCSGPDMIDCLACSPSPDDGARMYLMVMKSPSLTKACVRQCPECFIPAGGVCQPNVTCISGHTGAGSAVTVPTASSPDTALFSLSPARTDSLRSRLRTGAAQMNGSCEFEKVSAQWGEAADSFKARCWDPLNVAVNDTCDDVEGALEKVDMAEANMGQIMDVVKHVDLLEMVSVGDFRAIAGEIKNAFVALHDAAKPRLSEAQEAKAKLVAAKTKCNNINVLTDQAEGIHSSLAKVHAIATEGDASRLSCLQAKCSESERGNLLGLVEQAMAECESLPEVPGFHPQMSFVDSLITQHLAPFFASVLDGLSNFLDGVRKFLDREFCIWLWCVSAMDVLEFLWGAFTFVLNWLVGAAKELVDSFLVTVFGKSLVEIIQILLDKVALLFPEIAWPSPPELPGVNVSLEMDLAWVDSC